MVFVGNVNPEELRFHLSQPQRERGDLREFQDKLDQLVKRFQLLSDQFSLRTKRIESLPQSSSSEYLYEMLQVNELGNLFNQIVLDLNFEWASIHPPIPSTLSSKVHALKISSLAKHAECKALSDQLDRVAYVLIEKKIKQDPLPVV